VTAAEALERGNHPRAAPTIEICPGTYSKQVTISKSLRLARANVRSSAGPVIIDLPAAVGDDVSAAPSRCSAFWSEAVPA
jgi:hypothetical protein